VSETTTADRLEWFMALEPRDDEHKHFLNHVELILRLTLAEENGESVSEFERAQVRRSNQWVLDHPRTWQLVAPPWIADEWDD
jgi:hypothetical protein